MSHNNAAAAVLWSRDSVVMDDVVSHSSKVAKESRNGNIKLFGARPVDHRSVGAYSAGSSSAIDSSACRAASCSASFFVEPVPTPH